MLDFLITGKLPTVKTVEESGVMETIRDLMIESVRQNFIQGGRPAWQPKKDGSGFALGALYKSVDGANGADYAEVWAGAYSAKGYNYGLAQNFGATIPPVQNKFMAWQVNGKWIYRYSRAGFELPARPFMVLQSEDISKIFELVPKALISQAGD